LGRAAFALGAGLVLGGLLASAVPSRSQSEAAPPTALPSATAPAEDTKVAAQAVPVTAELLTASLLAKAELFAVKPEPWQDPPEAGSERPFPLVVDYAKGKVRVGPDGVFQDVRLRTYNGKLVGPTFRVSPGDQLRINLFNRLPKPDKPMPPMNMDNCGVHEQQDVTNLHTHGLHISPSGLSDNVLRVIPPGGPGAPAERYFFDILPAGNPPGEPKIDHHPGTDWYHAHLHGSTALQLASGMAGALLVKGDIDKIPPIEAAKERIFVFQQLAFDKSGEVKSIEDLNGNWTGKDPDKNGPPKHTSINGVVKPLITMHPKQVERWRMIDAGVFELLDLSIRKKADPSQTLPFHLLGLDGITLASVKKTDQLELGPGYRAEALVQAPAEPGVYELYKSKPAFKLLTFATAQESALADGPEILAEIVVDDVPCTPATSCSTANIEPGTKLPAPFRDVPEVKLEKKVTFSVVNDAGVTKFKINNECYSESTVMPEFQLKKGTTEQWLLVNTSGGPHPFHIHVNPFQMLNADGTVGEWRDTIIIPPNGQLRMRTRIERFTGKFVLHCHILTHEDRGMMQNVQVE
jgi:FtsP/CotA-like multicopper oxidase with cupredoxin domain